MRVNENFVEKLINNTLDTEKAAYIYKNKTVSYKQLFSDSEAIASSLINWGLRPGDRLLMLMNDTPALPTVFLAAIWVGVIPVPLNPKISKSSFAKSLDHSEANGVVLENGNVELKESITNMSVKTISQDLYGDEECKAQVQFRLSDSISACTKIDFFKDQPYCQFWQYTSGTTGDPKAVIHSTKGMEESAEYFSQGVLGMNSRDRIYSTAKMYFGYGLGNSLFFPLLNNATALLDDRWPTPNIVIENIRSFNPTVLCSVPNLYNAISMHCEEVDSYFDEGIRLLSAGAPLPSKLFTLWKERYGSEILDGVGATEVGHIFLSTRIGADKKKGVSPVPEYEIFLEKKDGNEANVGEQGVLLVKGPSVAKGYYKNKKKTEDRFVNGWYRTGDIFLRVTDNGYTYVGREDDLFKVKGKWVVPLKVENHILTVFNNISEVILVPHKNPDGLLETALMLNTSCSKDEYGDLKDEIQESLRDYFPSYIQPTAYTFLEDLPKNENGKLIRKLVLCDNNFAKDGLTITT